MVAVERALEVDVLLSCLCASEVVVVGDAWERTGEAEEVLRLREGETARWLVGELVLEVEVY